MILWADGGLVLTHPCDVIGFRVNRMCDEHEAEVDSDDFGLR